MLCSTATINGEQVTLNRLQELMQHPKQGHKTNYRFYDGSWTKDEHGNTPVGRSHWVLMTRDIIPKSRNKSYDNQKAMLEGTDYVLPQAVEAVACILAEFVASGTYLYGRDPLLTYTRCAAIPAGDFSRGETFFRFVNNGVDLDGSDVLFLSEKSIFSEVAETCLSGDCSAGTTDLYSG